MASVMMTWQRFGRPSLERRQVASSEETAPAADRGRAASPPTAQSCTDGTGRPCGRRHGAARGRERTFLHRRRANSGDAVAHLVARFNREALAAVQPGHGGDQPKRYTVADQQRILREVEWISARDTDRTATWSLTTLQRALGQAPDGLPTVSTYTIWSVLHDAGVTWQRDRT